MNAAPQTRHGRPWASPWLNWLEQVQAFTGLRSHTPAQFDRLRSMFDTGASVQDGAAWLIGDTFGR